MNRLLFSALFLFSMGAISLQAHAAVEKGRATERVNSKPSASSVNGFAAVGAAASGYRYSGRVFSEKEMAERKVKGHVTDTLGNPLVGVSVRLKGTSIGTVTDNEGNYTLTLKEESGVLVFSYLGYQEQERPVAGESIINVVLHSGISSLDQVVVVGYGKQRRATMTGAIVSVGTKELTKNPGASIGNTLAGKLTGVTTVQRSGQPGASDPTIYVRGVGSLSSAASSPLVLVDGVERPYNQIDPNTIESVSILKDASATAVYGVRGANGVILITTRRGHNGPAEIQVTSSFGFQAPVTLPHFTNSLTYGELYDEAQLNDDPNAELLFPQNVLDAFKNNTYPAIYPNTDFVDYVLKDYSFQTNNNINISGGNDFVKYFASVGYVKEDGMFKTFGLDPDFNYVYNRYNYRANLDVNVSRSTKLLFSVGGRSEVHNELLQNESQFSIWRNIYFAQPYRGIGVIDGKHIQSSNRYIPGELRDALNGYWGQGFQNNVKNFLYLDLQLNQDLNFITKGLSFRTKVSYNGYYAHGRVRHSSEPTYFANFRGDVDPTAPLTDSTIVFQKSGGGDVLGYSETFDKVRNWYLETAVSYDRTFENHHVTGLLLYNETKTFYPEQFAGIPAGYAGLVGRVTYDYKSKYLFEFDAGYNGSENFVPGRRFGFFPAASAGWVLSEEQFMKNSVPAVNFLKVRGSYGFVGNDQYSGSRFLYLPDSWLESSGSYSFGTNVPQGEVAAAEGRIGNPVVSWEKSRKLDVGLDLRLLNDKFSLTADYFSEHRTGILAQRQTVPGILALDLPIQNIGIVDNHGYEIKLEWKGKINNFGYSISPNMSFARNKVVYVDEVRKNYPYERRTGRPVNQPFGYVIAGFWTQDEVEHASDYADAKYDAQPGDIRYKDINGDGVIDVDDQQAIGYPEYPEYVFGLNIDLNYKGFYLSTQWVGAKDVSRYLEGSFQKPFGPTHGFGLMSYWESRWTPETASTATFPRLTFTGIQNNIKYSNFWLRDASYIRLKTVELGYSFKIEGSFLSRLGIRQFSVFTRGYNILTFSKLMKLNIDPESVPSESAQYPIMKIFNSGINLTF